MNNYYKKYQLSKDEIIEWIEFQRKISPQYKKAIKQLESTIKIVQKKILEMNDKNKVIKYEQFVGYDWYKDKSEISRFFIERVESKSEFPNYEKYLIETEMKLKAVKEKLEQKLQIDLKAFDLAKLITQGEAHTDEVDQKLMVIIQKDVNSKQVDFLLNEFIPEKISFAIENLFENKNLFFEKFKTFDQEVLDEEKERIYNQLEKEVINYLLIKINSNIKPIENSKEYLSAIEESIRIQLKSNYNFEPASNNEMKSTKKLIRRSIRNIRRKHL